MSADTLAPCPHCGGWTQNADGHRDTCPKRAKPERSSDAIMLLVWEQWAKREGNEGAAALFHLAADALTGITPTTGCCKRCGTPPRIESGPVNGIVCTSVDPQCEPTEEFRRSDVPRSNGNLHRVFRMRGAA